MSIKFQRPQRVSRSTASEEYQNLAELKELTIAGVPELKETDGWALIAEYDDPRKAYSIAAAFRKNRRKPEGSWEFKGERLDEETSGVLARFLGDEMPTEESA